MIPWQILRTELKIHHKNVVQDWTKLLDSGVGELECLAFLRENAGFFFCNDGRSLVAIAELEFGADFRPDFVVAHDMSSYGFLYEFIEIESPTESAFVSKSAPSARLNSAVGQISQWQLWLQGNREQARKILPSSEFWRRDRLAAAYTIVIGRREDGEDFNHLRNHYADKVDVQIRSFDYLTERARERTFAPVPILSSVEMDAVDPNLRNELANPFRKAISSGVWRANAPKLSDYHMVARNARTLVNIAQTSDRQASFVKDWEALPEETRNFYIAQAAEWIKP